MCGECIKHCPTDAYRKECHGTKSIEVDGHVFKFANKNLWRCAWAEHFDLDLDLEIPEVVDEKVILEYVDKYGMRGGEMGCCVKFCLPKHLRSDGGEHTSAPMRKKHSVANTSLPVHRRLYDEIASKVERYSIDNIVFLDPETTASLGAKEAYEYASGAVVMTISCKKSAHAQGDKINARNGYGNEGFGTISAEQTAQSVMLDEFKPEKGKKYALVFGNEVSGVDQQVVDASDFSLEVPQFGTKHSLNVSVTVGVILWHFRLFI